jgi:hypothetical protein
VGFVVDRMALGAGFLLVLRFRLRVPIRQTIPHSLIITSPTKYSLSIDSVRGTKNEAKGRKEKGERKKERNKERQLIRIPVDSSDILTKLFIDFIIKNAKLSL